MHIETGWRIGLLLQAAASGGRLADLSGHSRLAGHSGHYGTQMTEVGVGEGAERRGEARKGQAGAGAVVVEGAERCEGNRREQGRQARQGTG